MDGVAVAGVVHDVLGVSVAQADNVADLNRIRQKIETEMELEATVQNHSSGLLKLAQVKGVLTDGNHALGTLL